MPYLNVDIDYFNHPKVKRLVRLLGKGSEVLPLRLWCFTGRYFAMNGRLTNTSAQEIEAECGWWGKPDDMVRAMMEEGSNFLYQDGEGTWCVHEWLEYQGHIGAFKARGKAAANARWGNPGDANGETKPVAPVTGHRARDGLADASGNASRNATSITTSIAPRITSSNTTSNASSNALNQLNQPMPTKLTTKGKALGPGQRETARWLEELLGEQWVNDAGKWINRIKASAGLCERVAAEVKSAMVEGRVRTTPAQYAEQIFKEFSGSQK